ncbi:MGMT family protein [Tepidiforma sp.]|uniref:MGMT family protein n=1 Tax=Tepidiforma sp. TaxID=2682230 RepID=UPI0021DD06D9|nr:methylated-DNA--[protein]-cysteine S-methyltransferase [Tepidiforma sp.]MCX7616639.1 methylated-DNA--[protein]-cysteine S-methyltransferase [Tepidiforma sp.]GIW19633.1 MAG: methyltransferase [Tepidiforma sp.]
MAAARGPGETFYEAVYALVRRIPEGRVMTYGQVALELGAPAAARAVGYALAWLPQGTEVPWWRVVNAKGAISLRGRGEEADLQRRLLEAEGVVFGPDGRMDLGRYRWFPSDGSAGGTGASFVPGR